MDNIEDNPVGRPLAFKSLEDLEEAVDLYFETDAYIETGISDTGEPIKMYAPTMSGLALSLGVDRKTITNYANRDEFFPAIKKARSRVEVALEQRLYGNNVTGVIFNLKNNFDWRDSQNIDHTTNGKDISPSSVDPSLVQALINKLID